jgi:hypothetical protein
LSAKYRKNVRSVNPARGDLCNGGVLEPALAVESEGCLLKPARLSGSQRAMSRS